jgi:peptidoglycan/LPS O-acetylase OafA/YrhL
MKRASTTPNSRDITAYLKGLAILEVAVDHYVYARFTQAFEHYGNAIVALFFVLAGYGAAHSLLKVGRLTFRTALHYYWKRALRIYPLFSISLLLYELCRGQRHSVWVMMLFPTRQAPGTFWFLTSLVQRYLLAPLLYGLLQKLGRLRYIAIVIALALLVHAVYTALGLPYSRQFSVYRFVFVGHILLFSLGMAMPKVLPEPSRTKPVGRLALWLTLLAGFAVLANYVRLENMLFWNSHVYLAPLFLLYTVAFCWASLVLRPPLILKKLFVLLGTYSYPCYLFHTLLYLARLAGYHPRQEPPVGSLCSDVVSAVCVGLCTAGESSHLSGRHLGRGECPWPQTGFATLRAR